MDPALLEILCCPVTRQPLRVADAELLDRARRAAGRELAAVLVREDLTAAFPVVNGIPLLVPEEAIAL
jgi:uncharacterized protein YbaR (Trm112 family)